MSTLFVSDLHLPPAAAELRDIFTAFLAGSARKADALYILGDLFESWIGDDAGLAEYATEAACLRTLVGAGVPVYFMHGNRDFLVGAEFARATGVKILPDPFVLDLHGVRTLLSHGDPYCTGDVRYQRWRKFARNGIAQRLFRALPLATRQHILGNVKGAAHADKLQKDLSIMDVSEGAIRAAFEYSGARRIIHGHTHRPMEHGYAGGRARFVLADWHPGRCEALEVDDAGVRRVPVPLPA